MNPSTPLNLSVVAPLSPAIERVKTVLFRPFDLERWLIIGFCAWLAGLGSRGGGGGGGGHWGDHRGFHDARNALETAWEYVLGNLHWIVPLVAGLVLLGMGLWVLFTWLSSRGKFMFLHCVSTNRAEVRIPWERYQLQGNSLCWFRLGLGLLSFILVAPAILAGIGMIFSMILRGEATVALVIGTVLAFLTAIGLGTVLGVVSKVTSDFVVPVMVVRSVPWRPAWREVLRLLSAHKLDFLVFLLFQIVLAIVVGAMVLAGILITCCCAGCLLMIPYVGTVLLLPFEIFDRAYTLYYLAQYDPAYALIVEEPPLPVR